MIDEDLLRDEDRDERLFDPLPQAARGRRRATRRPQRRA